MASRSLPSILSDDFELLDDWFAQVAKQTNRLTEERVEEAANLHDLGLFVRNSDAQEAFFVALPTIAVDRAGSTVAAVDLDRKGRIRGERR